MTVLADSSVWIGHWRHFNPAFARRLDAGAVCIHPFVIGELAVGDISRRDEVLAELHKLPATRMAEHDEVLTLVAYHRLWGTGVGWVDAHLLASALLSGVRLWTLDRPLARQAERLGVAFAA